MTSADDEVVDARTARKTTKAAKLRSERTTQQQLYVNAAARTLPRSNNQWRWTTSSGTTARGERRSGNPKLDGVDAYSMTIGCRSRCSWALKRVIKPNMREVER
uniref:Uncharacterized protein n=1 Tax=Oryza rufipogon TaxID=4529 RepID=A0A0E0RB40_ORYRU